MNDALLPPGGTALPDLVHELSQPLATIASYAEACHLLLTKPGSETLMATTLTAIVAQASLAGQLLQALRQALHGTGTPAPPAGDDTPTLAALLARLAPVLATHAETQAMTPAVGQWRTAAVVAAGLDAELPTLAARLHAVSDQPCHLLAALAPEGGARLYLMPAPAAAASITGQHRLLDTDTADCAQRLLGCGISLSPHWQADRGLCFELRLPGPD